MTQQVQDEEYQNLANTLSSHIYGMLILIILSIFMLTIHIGLSIFFH